METWKKNSVPRIVLILWIFLITIVPEVVQGHGSGLKVHNAGLKLAPAPAPGPASILSVSTSRPSRRQVAVTRTLFLPVTPKPPKRKSIVVVEDYQNIEIFVNFLAAYSSYKRWEAAQLIFPRADPSLCLHLQVALLQQANLYASCAATDVESGNETNHNHATTNNNTGKKPVSTSSTNNKNKNSGIFSGKIHLEQNENFSNNNNIEGNNKTHHHKELKLTEPIIACHFLTQFIKSQGGGGGGERVNVNPKILINYHAQMEILVVGGNYEGTDVIIDQLAPEINTNYKWTLASVLNESHVHIEDVYGLATSTLPLRNPFGLWSESQGLSIDHRKLLGPKDFQGRLIRVTTVEGNPVVYLRQVQSNGSTVLKAWGYLPDILLETISAQLNFSYQLLTPADKSFGSADDEGNWSGMVGQLQRKEAEVAMMSFSLTEKRRMVMGFSPAIEYSSTRLLIRKDWQSTELKYKVFLQPFEYQVWLAIPVTIFLGAVTFVVFTYFKSANATPASSVWFLSMCFLQQGQEEHGRISTFPSRIALASFWILSVVLYASYTARLTSYLAANIEPMPLHSLAEAVDNNNWKIGLVKGSSVPDRVKDSKLPEFMKMWKRIQADQSGFVSGFQEGIDRVYNERFVFFTSELIPIFLIKGNCTYSWVPGRFFSGFGYMGYQKHLPYGASISSQVAKIRESGILRRLYKKWWGSRSSCSASNSGEFVAMSLYETCGAFFVLITGALLSFTFILVEFCLYLKQPPEELRGPEEDPEKTSSGSTQFPTRDNQEFYDANDGFNNGDIIRKINNTQNQPQTPISMWFTKIGQYFTSRNNTPISGQIKTESSLHF